jgi:anti-sigma factor RsiW
MPLLRHLRSRSRLEAYLDEELDAHTSATVARHVRECWFCSGDLQTLRLIRAALRRPVSPPFLPVLRLRRFAQQIEQL